MFIFVIILFLAAAYFAYQKNWKWAAILAAVALLIWLFSGPLSGAFGGGSNSDPLESTSVGGVDVANDLCGCSPGQAAKVYRKNVINRWKHTGNMPCAIALGLVNRNPKKYQLRGCAS